MSTAASKSFHFFSGFLWAWIIMLPKVNLRTSLLIPLSEPSCERNRMAFAKEYGPIPETTSDLRLGNFAVLISALVSFTTSEQRH